MTKGPVHILNADATKLPLPSNSVDLIITHPPYIGVDTLRYGGDSSKQINSSQDRKKMLKLLIAATKEMQRVLKPSGNIWIAIGPGQMLDLHYPIAVQDKTDLIYIEKIVQNSYIPEREGINPFKIASEDLTTWYHFAKEQNIYFNPYEVKKNSNPSWSVDFDNMHSPIDQALSISHFVSDVINAEIPRRLIKMFSKKDHVVLDPFGGSAIVAVTAAELGRVGISGDVSSSQTKAAIDRSILSSIEYTVDQKFI